MSPESGAFTGADALTTTGDVEPHLALADEVEHVGARGDLEIRIQSRLSILARAGLVTVALGLVSLLLSSVLFLISFPDKWYGAGTDSGMARFYVELIISSGGLGVLLILFGSSLFYYGRNVLGLGSLHHYEGEEEVQHA